MYCRKRKTKKLGGGEEGRERAREGKGRENIKQLACCQLLLVILSPPSGL